MADEIKIQAPQIEQNVNVVISGEEKLKDFINTLNRMSRGNSLQSYWKTQEVLIEDVVRACEDFKRVSNDINATSLINNVNALKAVAGSDISGLFKNFADIGPIIDKAGLQVGRVVGELSPENFKAAFSSFEMLKAEGLDMEEIFSRFSTSIDTRQLQAAVEQLNFQLQSARRNAEEARAELESFRNGDGIRELNSQLEYTQERLENLAERMQYEFSSFLSANDIAETDRWGWKRFEDYFERIRNGSWTAKEAIAQFKIEYAELFQGNKGVTISTEQMQKFINKLDYACQEVEVLANYIRSIDTSSLHHVTEELSADAQLSEQQRSAMAGLAQEANGLESVAAILAELVRSSESANGEVNTVYTSITQVLNVLREMGGIDVGNLDSLGTMFRSLGKLNEIKIEKAPLTNLADALSAISSIANTANLGIVSAIDFTRFNDLKVSKASLSNLAAYLPQIAEVNTGKLLKLSQIDLTNFNNIKVSKSSVDNLLSLAHVADTLKTVQEKLDSVVKQSANQQRQSKTIQEGSKQYGDALAQVNTQLISAQKNYERLGRVSGESARISRESIGEQIAALEALEQTLKSGTLSASDYATEFANIKGQLADALEASNAVEQTALDKQVKNTEDAAWRSYNAVKSAEERKQAEISRSIAEHNAALDAAQAKEEARIAAATRREINEYYARLDAEEAAINREVEKFEQAERLKSHASQMTAEQIKNNLLAIQVAQDKIAGKLASAEALGVSSDATNSLIQQANALEILSLRVAAGAAANEEFASAMKNVKLSVDAASGSLSRQLDMAKIFSESASGAKKATSEIAEFKVQLESLGASRTQIKNALTGVLKGVDDSERAEIDRIIERYQQWKIALEEVRIEKEFASSGNTSREAMEAEAAQIMESIHAVNERRLAVEEAARAEAEAAAAAVEAEKQKEIAAKETEKARAASQRAAEREIRNAATVQNLYKQISDAIQRVQRAQTNWTAASHGKAKTDYAALDDYLQRLRDLKRSFDTLSPSEVREKLAEINRGFSETAANIRAVNENTKSLSSRLGNLASKFSAWFSVSQVIMYAIRSIRRMISTSVELNSAMTQLRIVTRANTQDMQAYSDSISESAKKIGSSITDLVDSTTTFARLGYTLEESSALAEFTAMLQNVGDIDVSDAQDAITSIIKAFGADVDDIESIMDKLVITGNNFPISVSQIAEGMTNASSALAAAGNTFEQSVALLTAANTTIQNAAKASTGLRTIAARLRNTETELNELGEAMSESTYGELVTALTKYNVQLTDAAGQFRSTYDIIADIAKIWDDLDSMEQAGLATVISGTRQQAIFYSLVGQFKEASGAMDEMANSAGTLQKSYATYMESTTAHINQFKAAFQTLSQDVFTTGFLNSAVDLGTRLVNVLDAVVKITNAIGGLNTALVITGVAIAVIKREAILSLLNDLKVGIVSITTGLINLIAHGAELPGLWATFRLAQTQAIAPLAGAMAELGITTGGVIAAVVALVAVLALVIKAYKSAHPSLETLKEDLKKLEDEQESLTKQLDDNNERIKELQELAANGTISLVEEQELERLERQNQLLQQQVEIVNALADAKRNEAYEKASDDAQQFLDDTGFREYHDKDIRVQEQWYTGAGGLRAAANDYVTAKKAYEDAVSAGALAAAEGRTADVEQLRKEEELYSKRATEAMERIKTLQQQAIDLRNSLNPNDAFSADQIQQLDMLLDKVGLLVSSETAYKNIFDRFFKSADDLTAENIQAFKSYLESLGESIEGINHDNLSAMFGSVGKTAADGAKGVKQLTDVLDKYNAKAGEIYAHGGNVDLLDRKVVTIDGNNLAKVRGYDKDAEAGGVMTVLSKTYQDKSNAIVVTPILPNGSILSSKELDKYLIQVISETKSAKDGDYQAHDEKGIILGVFSDKTTFDENNKLANQFANSLHEIHAGLIEVSDGNELNELLEELVELAEYNPSLAAVAEKFADVEDKINKVGTGLKEFKEDGAISVKALNDIGSAFGDLSSFEKFVKTLTDSSATMSDAKAAANDLAAEFINSSQAMDMLREGNEEVIKSILTNIGVTNADEVATEMLRDAKSRLAVEAAITSGKLDELILSLGDESAYSEAARASLIRLATQMVATNDTKMDFTQQLSALRDLARQAGVTGALLTLPEEVQRQVSAGTAAGFHMLDNLDNYVNSYVDSINKAVGNIKFNFDWDTAIDRSRGSGSTSKTKKETDKYIAEIDRFREAVKRLEDTQAEAARLERAVDNSGDLRERSELRRRLADSYTNEQEALHNLNEERRAAIAEGVDKLTNLGFVVDYDPETNELFVRNMEHLNELATDDLTKYETMADMSTHIIGRYENAQEATNGLIKDTEGIIDTITSLNQSNQQSSDDWLTREKDKVEAVTAAFDDLSSYYQNALTLTENWLDNAVSDRDYSAIHTYVDDTIANYRAMQENIHAQAEYYRSKGYSDTSDEVSKLSDLWWDYEREIENATKTAWQKIVENASGAVDEIQNAYDTLHSAADEYAASGFVTIDTLQSIIALGAQYMQYLTDENGLLVINHERIDAVMAAKTEELALEQALAYVERLRLTMQNGSAEELNNLLYATTKATDATWGLVYANLALLGLDDKQYEAALHNINSLRSIAASAISGIGKTANANLDALNDMKSGVDDILKYVMEMLKQRIQDQIDALEDMKKAYQDIINLRKEALDDAKKEADYQDEVAKKIKEIAKLQARINALSLDDSRDAKAQQAELEEQMYDLQKDLSDKQADYARDAQKDALDDMQEAYEEQKDEEIEVLEKSISSYQKLYDMAIAYISDHWETLYDELISWNTEYGSVLNSEITSAWENCLAAAQRYGSYVSAMNAIPADIQAAGSDTHHDTVDTSANFSQYAVEANEAREVAGIVTKMKDNSLSWHTSDNDTRKELHRQNLREYVPEIEGILGKKLTYDNGIWYLPDGRELYKVYGGSYHTGGIAGSIPAPKQNEILALLEKGEAILDERKERGLYRLVDFATNLSDKFDKLIASTGIGSIFSGLRTNLAEIGTSLPVVEGTGNQVQFGDVYIYGANEETVEKHREINRQFTNEVIRQLNIKR